VITDKGGSYNVMAITTVGGKRHLVLAIISGLAIVLATILAIVLTTILATGLNRCRWICKGTIRGERNTIRFQLIRATNNCWHVRGVATKSWNFMRVVNWHGVYIGLRFFQKNSILCFLVFIR